MIDPEILTQHLRALRELMLEGKAEDAIEWCDIAIKNLLRHGDLVAEECDHRYKHENNRN